MEGTRYEVDVQYTVNLELVENGAQAYQAIEIPAKMGSSFR